MMISAFQYAVTVALNHQNIKKKIQKEDQKLILLVKSMTEKR